ncbi:metal-dependent hydrolase [Actinorhabdospora filicis]|uniref:Metal-dependent hydrolase n=1 Tax=Actinorhabdospora filicis TaxID=1785913 RepID=A0A9W6WAD1_9ACTN|nr:endonuclease/exonuclease/phosphatase family protein [Actinorhabdospora filicis]GLZ78893.1 metal-dependent hydrolase [Actinorhabdospora filicis]
MGSVRVVSYNIHHGADDRNRPSLDRIGAALARLAPDLVGLQEVDRRYGERSGWADQAGELGERLGMEAVFLPSIRRGDGGYGNAILSRFPVLDSELAALPTRDSEEDRAVIRALVSTPDGPLHMVNTHLNHLPWDGAGRSRQLVAVGEFIARARQGRPAPVVLTGDFNAPPRRGELVPLRQVLNDGWAAVRPGPLGWLSWFWGRAPGGTFPSVWPVRRIDYVHVSPELVPVAAFSPRGRASDHRPIVVDLRVGAGGAA